MFKRVIIAALFAAFVALPAGLKAQAPASVCKDGTTSNATGSGACSGHGGVDKAATKKAHTPPPPPPAPAPASASAPHGTPVKCADGTMGTSGQGACSHHGGIAHTSTTAANAAPAAAPAPAPAGAPNHTPTAATGAAVKCADGTFSNATGSGACSHHGGVAHAGAAPTSAAQPPAAPPAANPNTTPGSGDSPNNNPQGAIAQCKDNTYSHAKQHSGACSKHGGVKKWLDGTTPS
jgi:hypothetical protein